MHPFADIILFFVFFVKKCGITYDLSGLIALLFLKNNQSLKKDDSAYIILTLLQSPQFKNLNEQFLQSIALYNIENPIALAKKLGYTKLIPQLKPYDIKTWTKIYEACQAKNIIKILALAKKAQSQKKIMDLALCRAALLKNSSLTNELLQAGSNPDTFDIQLKKTPLIIACNNLAICTSLTAHNADINLPDENGYTPLMHAVYYYGNTEIIEFLLKNKADYKKYSYDNKNAISCAVEGGCEDNLKVLLQYGVPLNTILIDLLFIDVKSSDMIKILKLLLAYGADPNDQNFLGTTTLTMLINTATPLIKDTVYKLLQSGANPNVADDKGNTPLFYSVLYPSNEEIIDLLLQYGANPNLKNKKNKTPLIKLAKRPEQGYSGNVLSILKCKNINIFLTNALHQDAFDIAFDNNNPHCLFALDCYKAGYSNGYICNNL